MSMDVDFIAVGDTVVDDFIRLSDARIVCDAHDKEKCEICVRYGDKVPFDSSTVVYGVGNAANAAVCAARLGLKTALIANTGKDMRGDTIVETFKQEGMETKFVHQDPEVPTNYHYVLWYGSERTILVKQNQYSYEWPDTVPEPKTLYFSSINEHATQYRDDMIAYLEARPNIFFVFQPGVFEIKSGADAFARFYDRANLVVCNKEEAERILSLPSGTEIKQLLSGFSRLKTDHVVITDGRNGAYGHDGTEYFFVPMYPDPREPYERTGAGDAFASSIAVALTLGKPLHEALLWGPINSMSVVQEIGAQKGLVTRAQMDEYLAQAPHSYSVQKI